MENNFQTPQQQSEINQIIDISRDDYWAKKYDVSASELIKTQNAGISATIIEAGKRNKTFGN